MTRREREVLAAIVQHGELWLEKVPKPPLGVLEDQVHLFHRYAALQRVCARLEDGGFLVLEGPTALRQAKPTAAGLRALQPRPRAALSQGGGER